MTRLIVAGLPLMLGFAFSAAATILALPLLRIRRHWSGTTGTVVDVEEFVSGDDTVRRVEVRFRDASDREWTAASPVVWSTSRYLKDADVPILFDPKNPTSVRVNTFAETWLFPTVVGTSGAVGVLLGLCLAAG